MLWLWNELATRHVNVTIVLAAIQTFFVLLLFGRLASFGGNSQRKRIRACAICTTAWLDLIQRMFSISSKFTFIHVFIQT